MNPQDSGARSFDDKLRRTSFAESEIAKRTIYKKYTLYRWADAQISFALIAAICLYVISRYTDSLAPSVPIVLAIIAVLSSAGIFILIKKREWLYRKKRAEKKLK